ncbi:hypothetical protein FQA47_023348 [Oryzias melastigma]|uniref:Uncharacterized protein n=1 Tax=Oryzias melastigma TaxID=30732 RepID=A0A834C9M3_ORYME|nr:hypothetical protein FQA47_023348 [Oryzias melastigma]
MDEHQSHAKKSSCLTCKQHYKLNAKSNRPITVQEIVGSTSIYREKQSASSSSSLVHQHQRNERTLHSFITTFGRSPQSSYMFSYGLQQRQRKFTEFS